MTEETGLEQGQGDQPAAPRPSVTMGLERKRLKTIAGQGDLMGEGGETQNVRDSLTGALSRASLHDRLRHEVDRARRYGLPLSILVIDLDHFKSVNDAFGHTRGDKVLMDFVERMHSLARDSDLLFRYGGDEFILLLPHTDSLQAPAFARRLIDTVHALPFPGVPPLSVTLSVGSASFPGDGQTAEDLFERADRRLYEAKRQGRGRVVADDPAAPQPFTFEVEARLLERELPLTALRHFLDSLPEHKRGLFTINGRRGVGKTGFLAEVAKAARLRGYAVWTLQGRASMRNRLYGALAEAPPPASSLPPPAAGETLFIQALQRSLIEQGQAGLFIAVDRLADLDPTTLDLLRQILFTPELSVVALAYTVDSSGPRRASLLEAALRVQVELEALTPQGVRLWVRSTLRWEPPTVFSDWLHRETQGLPGHLSQALHLLLDRDVLQIGQDTWQLAPGFESLRLADLLKRRQHAPPQNLPVAPSGFVGRHEELQEIKRLLRSDRPVVMVGTGGIGKTRLAVQAAAEMSEQFEDGLFFVPLDGVTSAGFVVSAIAHALGVAFAGAEDARTQLLRHLHDKTLLLILDDFAPHLDAADLLLALEQQAPDVRLLVTARERLNLPGDTTFELRGLPIPPMAGVRGSAPASHYGAEQLFLQGAQRAAPDFTLNDEDRLYVRRICQLVEGMPLGIELAAAWTPLFKCREIAAQIESSLDFLVTSRTEVPEGQRSARAVLDYFWSLLAEDERRRLRWLAVFRGGFEREAAHAVAGASLFFLSALVDKAFLRKGPSGRYVMHEMMRQYAETKLHASPDEWNQAASVHGDYYAEFLMRHQAPVKGGAQSAALANLRLEIGNIRAAWQWAALHGRAEAVRQSFETLVLFYATEQWYQEGAETFTRAVENWRVQHPAGAADPTLAQLSAGRGAFLHRLGQNPAALDALQESLAHVRPSPVDPAQQALLAFSLYYLGLVQMDLGDYAAAQVALRESLGLGRALNDPYGIALALNNLAGLAYDLGDYAEARRLFQESLQLRRNAGDQHGVVLSLGSLGEVAIDLGDYREAQEALRESAALAQTLGLGWGRAYGQHNLGRLAAARGDHTRARECFEASLAFNRTTGNQKDIGFDLLGLGGVALDSGSYLEAERLHREAVALFQATGYQRGLAMSLTGLGEVALLTDIRAAYECFHPALVIAMRIRALPWVLAALVGIAPLWVRAGRSERAVELLTFGLYHPASNRRTQNQAARLLSRLEGELPAAVVGLAEERGRRLILEPLVAEIVAEETLADSDSLA